VSSDAGRMEAVAGAILDGTPIDWDAVDSAAAPPDRPVLRHMKAIAAIAAAQSTDMPDTWGPLRLLERIGQGAFGDVYRAWDPRLDREVALKLMPDDRASSNQLATSIIEEGRLLARIRHPNVVTIYGAERIGRRIGLWMEFVRGRTLKQIVDDGRVFSGAEAIEIGVELCRAVAAVHGAGLLHRDIKAQNVMLAVNGRPVLMDFGTGRELADNSASDLAGTPLYLAPEILGGREAAVQSDIYSLGVLLYYLVTGSYPVRARTLRDVRGAHERHERVNIRTARPDLSPKLARIIERAIDPQPEHRFQSADAFAADLAALKRRPILVSFGYATAVAAALILMLGLGWEGVGRQMGSSRTPSTLLARFAVWNPLSAGNLNVVDQPVIAVLPFENYSTEPDSDYFVDGLTDEIIRNLAVIRGLQVRSRTSSFAFKGKPRNLRDVGAQLGANLIVEGSVLRSGTKLRITAQLVQVAGEVPLWAESFDREAKSSGDVFAILDGISRAIVNELRLTLDRGQRRYELDLETYELYLRGRALLARRSLPACETAADIFEKVLDKDRAFAPAYAGLANAYAFLSLSKGRPFKTAHSMMRPAAAKAIELDPLLGEAHAAMGWVYSYDFDWENAEKSFQRAIELDPGSTQISTGYAIAALEPLGKLDEALRILRVALRNDPLSLDVQREIGQVQLLAGRYGEALDTFERIHAVDPQFPYVDDFIARALMYAGRLSEALPLLEKHDSRYVGVPGRVRRNPWLAQAYVKTGRREEAETLAEEHEGDDLHVAIIYAALGDKDRAFEALERAALVEPHRVPRTLINPEMAVLRGDPRLAALRKKFRLPVQ